MKLVLLTGGEYSDYSVYGLVEWLSDISDRQAIRDYLEEHPRQREDYEFERDEFVAWLLARGIAREVDYEEFHLGSYGCPPDLRTDEEVATDRAEQGRAEQGRRVAMSRFGHGTPTADFVQCMELRHFVEGETSGCYRCLLAAGHEGAHRMMGDEQERTK